MAINMSNNFKNHLLTKVRTELANGGKYVAIEGYDGTSRVTPQQPTIQGEFDTVSNGELFFKSPVDLPVTQNEINKLIIYGNIASAWVKIAEVTLEGTEIVDFSANAEGGIYRINTFKLKL